MRRPSATHSRTITKVAIGIGATQGPYWAHPGQVQDAIKSSHPSPTPASHFLAPEHPNPRAIDDSAPLRAQLTGKRAPTPCHDRAGGSRQADPSSNKGSSALALRTCVLPKVHRHTPPHHAIVSNAKWRLSPTICTQQEPIAERASRSTLLCMSRVAAECHETAQAAHPCTRTLEGDRIERRAGWLADQPTAVRVGKVPFQFANRNRQQRQRSAKPPQHRLEIGTGA
jgi:hypothetical protein